MMDGISVTYQDSQEEIKEESVTAITFGRANAMEKPMTTGELFEKIKNILQEKNKLPDILDYSHATNAPCSYKDL